MFEQPRPETPLHYLRGASRGPREANGLLIAEAGLRRCLSIRGSADNARLAEAVRSVTGLPLPVQPLSFEHRGNSFVFWQGPTEWMLVTDQEGSETLEADLRRALASEAAAVVDVSGGQTLLSLAGSALSEVLQKSSSYDFHPANFPVGKCVQTVFAKATALVARLDGDSVLMLVRRSFADYLALWLLDAAAEYGVIIAD
jgi:sarcosine oxidase subunit gamma